MYRTYLSSVLTASSIAIFSAVLAGCGSNRITPGAPSSPSSAGSSFSVASTVPANAATNVALNSTIQIVFSSAATASTVNTTDIVVTDPSGAVSGAVSYNSSSNAATFTPSGAFVAGTTYTVKVSGVTSSGGTAMASADTFTFATVPPPPAPQYQASFADNSSSIGQVTVDTAGNVAVQLAGAPANQVYAVEFCTFSNYQTQSVCLSIGSVSTDGSGDGSLMAMFPKAGAWVGDFQLYTGTYNPNAVFAFSTSYGTNYMSTLLGGTITTINTGAAASTNGTVAYSTSPAPNGTLTFILTGGPANTAVGAVETDLHDGSGSQPLGNSQGPEITVTTNSAGDATLAVFPSGLGGDIFLIGPSSATSEEYYGGFLVP